MDEEKIITIDEAIAQWSKISQLPQAVYFGQYIKELEDKGYKIKYSGDKYEA